MSLIHSGVPHRLAVLLSKPQSIDTFIETGTKTGDSTAWAAKHFRRAVSIEADPELYHNACTRFSGAPNVEVRHGDSGRVLAQLLPALSAPALFWPDAHGSDAGTVGEDRECPLLDEIAAINASPHAHVLLIDDAPPDRRMAGPAPPDRDAERIRPARHHRHGGRHHLVRPGRDEADPLHLYPSPPPAGRRPDLNWACPPLDSLPSPPRKGLRR